MGVEVKAIKWDVRIAPEKGKLFLVFETEEPGVFYIKIVEYEPGNLHDFKPSKEELKTEGGKSVGFDVYELKNYLNEQYPWMDPEQLFDLRKKLMGTMLAIGSVKVAILEI